ncbi:type II toxin-antitoxin system VapC family toxin [Burkholderiaceae bacterium DAT-1]|nr:type II toxin-antitoxin system VapC family toxin [Burkholderiaceae bacterium DAT-1]
MVSALFDTNILIDYLNGVEAARAELALYSDKAISIISWMEVMAGTNEVNAAGTKAFLAGFSHLPIEDAVAERAVYIRQTKRIKLPDAIIWATAQVHHRLLVTRNVKDMKQDEPGVRLPYTL